MVVCLVETLISTIVLLGIFTFNFVCGFGVTVGGKGKYVSPRVDVVDVAVSVAVVVVHVAVTVVIVRDKVVLVLVVVAHAAVDVVVVRGKVVMVLVVRDKVALVVVVLSFYIMNEADHATTKQF